MSSSPENYLTVFRVFDFPMLLPISQSRGDLPTSTTLFAIRFPIDTRERVYGLTIELTSFSSLCHASLSNCFAASYTTRVSAFHLLLYLRLLSRLCISAYGAPFPCRIQMDRCVVQSRSSSSSLLRLVLVNFNYDNSESTLIQVH